jgi:hypothetical protein
MMDQEIKSAEIRHPCPCRQPDTGGDSTNPPSVTPCAERTLLTHFRALLATIL